MKSYIIGSTSSAPSTSAVNYNSPTSGGTGSWGTVEATRSQVVPHAMTLDRLRVAVTTAPGAGKSYQFTLMVNGVASTLTCIISGTATSEQDIAHSVSLNAGDTISLRCTPTGTPAASGVCYWTIRQSATDLFGVLGQNVASPTTGTNWQPAQNRALISSTNVLANQIVPTAGVLKNLFVNYRSAPGASNSLAVTLYVNGVASTLTTTVSGTATQSSDTTHSVSVNAGDKIALQLVATGTPVSTTVSFGMSFDPTTDGESFIANNANGVSASTTATNYQNLVGPDATWNATEANRLTRLAAGTIKAMYIETSVSPGVSPKAYAFTLRQNTVDTAAAVTINDASTAVGSTRNGSITGLNIAVTDDDRFALKSVPTGTPSAVFAKMSLLIVAVDLTGPQLVQSKAVYNNGTAAEDPTVTLDSAPTPGNYLLFAFTFWDGPGGNLPAGVTQLGAPYDATGAVTLKYGYRVVQPGDSASWTFDFLTTDYRSAIVMEWSGVGSIGNNGNASSNGTSHTQTTVTGVTGDTAVLFFGRNQGAVNNPTGGWLQDVDAPSDFNLSRAYYKGAIVGSNTAVWSGLATNGNVSALVMLNKVVAGGTTGQIKVYNGASFVAKPVKVWNGSTWVTKPVKRWNGTSWVTTTY